MTIAVQDLMTFLREQYQEELERQKKETTDKELEEQIKPKLSEFIRFARDYLAKVNQPLNVTYLTSGLGLKLQQGQIVCFVPQHTDNVQMHDEGTHITRPQSIPGTRGISDINAVGIFGDH